MRMAENGREYLWVHRVSKEGDEGEGEEKNEVEDEEDDRDYLLPVCAVRLWNLVQHDGYDACAHCDDEPSVQD